MVWIVLLVVLVGLILCYMLRAQPGVHRRLAFVGTVVGLFSILTGLSIGAFVAPLAALLLVLAAAGIPARRSND